MGNYTIEEHIHRYATWTAAAAVRRAFAGNQAIKQAINEAGIRKGIDTLLEKKYDLSEQEFNTFHKNTATHLIDSFAEQNVSCTYGRAAKIIAIYLKTSVVIRFPDYRLSHVAHPPIDRILLTKLSDKKQDPSLLQSWTKLEEEPYFELVEKLRDIVGSDEPFWKLEQDWEL